jgi:hypothetical protein
MKTAVPALIKENMIFTSKMQLFRRLENGEDMQDQIDNLKHI